MRKKRMNVEKVIFVYLDGEKKCFKGSKKKFCFEKYMGCSILLLIKRGYWSNIFISILG
jgi:hypothetical protein